MVCLRLDDYHLYFYNSLPPRVTALWSFPCSSYQQDCPTHLEFLVILYWLQNSRTGYPGAHQVLGDGRSSNHAISNIALKRIKISRFGDLNDPFELLAAKATNKKLRKALRSWKQEFHETKGLLCFSENWSNPVLWSHYADRHRGISLGFDVSNDLTLPVNYSKDRVEIRFEGNDPNNGLSEAFVDELLRTKYDHWIYEEERRVFVGLDEGTNENGLYFYPFDSFIKLREIVVGANCKIPMKQSTETVQDHLELVAQNRGISRKRILFNVPPNS